MLIIRSAQMDAFQPQADADFEMRIIEYLREEYEHDLVKLPKGVFTVEQNTDDVFSIDELSDEILLEMVRQGIRRAGEYGMTWEETLAAFVAVMVSIAPNFDEHPVIKSVLQDKETEPDLRIDRLLESTTDDDWETAIENYDPEAWLPKIDDELVNWISNYLREDHPKELVNLPEGDYHLENLDDATLDQLVRYGIRRARQYDIVEASGLAAYITHMFVMGPNFDEHPIISEFLQNDNIPPDSRLDEFWNAVNDEQWEKAQQKHEVKIWDLGKGENNAG